MGRKRVSCGFTGVRFLRAIYLPGVIGFASVSIAIAAPQTYVTQATSCDGFPRVAVEMASGFCVGLVTAPPEEAFHSAN